MPRVKETYQELVARNLPKIFYEADLKRTIKDLNNGQGASSSTYSKLLRAARPLDAEWSSWANERLYSYQPPESIFEILAAFTARPTVYLSHYSALYLHGLIQQRPEEHFLTIEKKGKSSGQGSDRLDFYKVQQAFMKAPRISSNRLKVLGQTIVGLEKLDLGRPGVIEIERKFEDESLRLRSTSISRTFIDSIISPQYSGGILSVVTAFRTQDLDPEDLFETYSRLKLIYPYWQSVGLILDKIGQERSARLWKAYFRGKMRIPFYITHEARSTWVQSKDWDVSYPEGLFP